MIFKLPHPLVSLRLILGMLLMMGLQTFAASAQAQLSAEVDRRTIGQQETLTLTLRLEGSRSGTRLDMRGAASEGPDLSELRQNFDILSNQSRRQMSIVNGRSEAWTEWQLRLAPLKAGELTIPALEVNGLRSEPITITVEQNRPQPQGRTQDIFVETELDKTSVHVQEQVLYTVRLYSKVNLDAAEMQPLDLEDAVMKAVNENNYITEIDNRQHLVLETTFALFPQKSGELVIPSLTYDLVASRGQRDPWGSFYSNDSRRQRLRTEEHRVEVRPIPGQFTGDHWLPAKEVRLQEHWSRDPEDLTQGEPVTRRITLSAEGLTAPQLPPLPIGQVAGVNFYPDQPQTNESVSAEGVASTSIQTLAMVPNQSGTLTLPAISMQWWDTTTGELRRAELPETNIRVQPAPGASRSQTAPASDPTPITTELPGAPSAGTGLDRAHTWLAAATAVLMLLLLLTSLGYLRLRRELKAIRDLYRDDQRQIRTAERSAWAKLKRDARDNNLAAVRESLLSWARGYWPQESVHSLSAVARLSQRPGLEAQVRALDASLFGDHRDTDFDPELLLREVDALRTRKKQRQRDRQHRDLDPLYGPRV